MKRQVIRAEFHDLNVVIPGLGGNLPNRLPNPAKHSDKPPLMFMTEYGLEVSAGGTTTLVPLANIKIAVFANEKDNSFGS